MLYYSLQAVVVVGVLHRPLLLAQQVVPAQPQQGLMVIWGKLQTIQV
jgi:hypothetical protein